MSAISALKGYRKQFLYSLYYILKNKNMKYSFRLEGKEDLDIYDEQDNLLFAIQIKSLSSSITLSDLLSKEGTSFFRRFFESYPESIPCLVSFGEISSEIKGLKHNVAAISKADETIIKKYKIDNKQWLNLKDKIHLLQVDEKEIEKEILTLLREFTTIDPIPAAHNILYWLSIIAEKQKAISFSDLFKKIEGIASYLSQRVSLHEFYGHALKPLHQLTLENSFKDKLRNEFYIGISAKYEHILCNLDIPRQEQIEKIKLAFAKSNVVVVFGASGQGKTTISYRYAHDYSPEALLYEIILQEDSIATNKAIELIFSLTKGLEVPVLFVLQVKPNSTDWLRIISELAYNPFIRFLITIRNEDLNKALGEGINFLYETVELTLTKAEAEQIYEKLNTENQILGFADFEEVWIKMGEAAPLLELVYTITQGDTLKKKLYHQLSNIANEDRQNNNESQIEILRLVSLSDSLGARLEIEKLINYPGLKFILDKFEKEYLLKLSTDKKYIVGLHPVRSTIMTEILFDEFTISKGTYISKLIEMIDGRDMYFFLVQTLYEEWITVEELLQALKSVKISWTAYSSILKGMLWFGIKNYIKNNIDTFNQCYDKCGDSWNLMLDIYHGNTLDIDAFWMNSSVDKNGSIREACREYNKTLSPKVEMYVYAQQLLNAIEFPLIIPNTRKDWESLGEIMFWIKNIPNRSNGIIEIKENEFEAAFYTLDVFELSSLMLGMYYYSERSNTLRIKLSSIFIEKMMHEYKIPLVTIDNELKIDRIIELFDSEEHTSIHDITIEVIDLFRYAFPDKSKYSIQGYGHNLTIFPILDESHKSISHENLPLYEWVGLNATAKRIYDYGKRPKDWHDFNLQLSQWEGTIKDMINQFNLSISNFFKTNNTTSLSSIAQHANYSNIHTLMEPQSITDRHGITFNSKRRNIELLTLEVNEKLKTKSQPFFKVYRDFGKGIEKFITQSGNAVYKKAFNNLANDTERISQNNLYTAIEKFKEYVAQKEKLLGKYQGTQSKQILRSELDATAVNWHSFLNFKNSSSKRLPENILHKTKSDFEARIIKGLRVISKDEPFSVSFNNSSKTEFKPIFFIESKWHIFSLLGLKRLYDILKQILGAPEYTSLKQLILQTHFNQFYFIFKIEGRTLENTWYQLPLYIFRDTDFENVAFFHLSPKKIDEIVSTSFHITPWNALIPKIDFIKGLITDFTKVRVLVDHVVDLEFFADKSLIQVGEDIANEHFLKSIGDITNTFQSLLSSLEEIVKDFENDAEDYNEIEIECYKEMKEFRKFLFPTDKGNEVHYNINLDFAILKAWRERLVIAAEPFGRFTILLNDKYIQEYNSNNMSLR